MPRFIRRTVQFVWKYITWAFDSVLYVLFRFLLRWVFSRPGKSLLWGLPAILIGGVTVSMLVAAQQHWRYGLSDAYLRGVATASRQENWKLADLCLRKLARLDQSNPATRYNLALAAEKQGDLERARKLMQSIAPLDQLGYPRAHFWLALHLAQNQSPMDRDTQELVEHHLKSCVGRMRDDVRARVMLGELYAKQNRLQLAVEQLKQVVDQRPAMLLPLAQIYQALDREDQARDAAEQASAHFRKMTRLEPQRWGYRLVWARAELLLKNYRQSIGILLVGLTRASAARDEAAVVRFRQTLATAYVRWYDALEADTTDQLARRLELLQNALSFAPNNIMALNRLAALAVADEDPTGEAEQMLKQVLASGRAPATVHFIIGTTALFKGDEDQAIKHLELAFAQLPQMPAVANNLAWALAHRTEPDLDKALKLAEVAIKLAPQNPEIRETRGVILAKLDRHKEAILDLEEALQSFPKRKRLHEVLAQLYDEIGDAKMASAHRELVLMQEGDLPAKEQRDLQ